MLPTKGYFQDIECPYFNSLCGRPYCHFRHRKKPSEHVEEVVAASEKEATPIVPTYKPTPKSQLASIHNIRSHIPISYVPDLAFRSDKKFRTTSKIENPTYKPTPLSILSSANNQNESLTEENKQHIRVINEIKQNIANVEYDPTISLQSVQDIDFEDLSNEFDLIDEIINSNDKSSKPIPEGDPYELNESSSKCNNIDLFDESAQDKTNKYEFTEQIPTISDNQKGNCKKTLASEKSNKTDANSKLVKEVESTIQKVTENIRTVKSSKDNENETNSDLFECVVDKKESSHQKKHKKDTSRSPSQEINKSKEKHPSKEKQKNKERDSEKSRKDKKESKDGKYVEKVKKDKTESKNGHSSKDKDKYKSKEKIKSEPSKSKEEKRHSGDKQDRTNHRKNKEKEKEKTNKERSRSRSIEHKSSKKDKADSKERSRSRSKEHKSNKKEKTNNKERSPSRSKESKIKKEKADSKESRKKEKVDSKESKSSKKEKVTSKERSRSRSKERRSSKDDDSKESKSSKKEKVTSKERSRSRSKERRHSRDDDKRRKHSSKAKKSNEKDKSKGNKYVESVNKNLPSNNMDFEEFGGNEFNFLDPNPQESSDSDIDINEDETMLECYRIFNEYKPQESISVPQISRENEPSFTIENEFSKYSGKKRIAHANFDSLFNTPQLPPPKQKTVQNPGQTLANRYKIAKEAQASREQELLMTEVQQTVLAKRPPPSLLEAARERKKMREMDQSKKTNLIDDILKGSKTVTYTPTPKLMPKKISPVQNVMAMAKAKERIARIKTVEPPVKTVAQTQKGSRTAHVPDISLSDIPDVLQADKSKLPVNVRTRFLTMLADECVKLYISKEEAYSRALKEEFNCYEKCKVLTTYRNSAMLAVNRLRKEIQERNKNGMGLIGIGEDTGEGSGESKSTQFYNKIKKWILTDEELDVHGYPRQTDEFGVAIVKNFKSKLPSNLDENQRICSRCHKLYHVDDDGWPLFEEECCYHPMKRRTIRGEQTYLCCRSNDEMGCATSDTHVFDGFTSAKLEGFQTTMDSAYEEDPRNHTVYALDCEMCYTTKGLELTRVTIVDSDCKTVYESLVKPLNPIIDYNTRFSGITKEQMDKTSTSILQVQANILHLCNSMTILVGHSLESDMKALKIVHGMIIDTAVLFPHKMGLPHKRALRVLASEYLRKIIQNDVSGHDSAEDAITCMELLKWKLKEESRGKH